MGDRGTKEFAVCRLDKSILQALPNWARESPRVELRCVCVILLICKTHGSIERGGCPIEMQAVDDVVYSAHEIDAICGVGTHGSVMRERKGR